MTTTPVSSLMAPKAQIFSQPPHPLQTSASITATYPEGARYFASRPVLLMALVGAMVIARRAVKEELGESSDNPEAVEP